MMKKPVLVVMAAGMGSRYGGLKQIDPIDKEGHIIMDFSIYDAVRAGFEKVVFIIKRENEQAFREAIGDRLSKQIEVAYVFQELTNLPEGYRVPEGRVKPWGTGHAVLSCIDEIDGPFAVINADDFYGAEAFRTIAEYLRGLDGASGRYCMVAYELSRTLSENGTVSRGVCSVNAAGDLTGMVEHTQIERTAAGIVDHGANGDEPLAEDTPVSMNLFGFTPDYFAHSEAFFRSFLQESAGNLKAECYIPSMVNKLIADGTASVRVLRSPAQWFGVTYKEDKPLLVANLKKMIRAGIYPEYLWR